MKISIVTATYNSGNTLPETIESVLRQSYKDIEFIIVDGLSTDKTLEIIKYYKNILGDKLKYISEKDNGIYDAMNKGIRMATGEVVGILNSDDYYTSTDVLSRIAERFEDEKIDAVYGNLHYIKGLQKKCVRYYCSRLFCPSFMLMGFIPPHPTFYCRKKAYDECGLYNTSYIIAADFEQLLRMIYIKKINAVYLPMDFVAMRMGGASTANVGRRWIGYKEHRRALKSNGVFCSHILLSLLFVYRIYEIMMTPILYKRSLRNQPDRCF